MLGEVDAATDVASGSADDSVDDVEVVNGNKLRSMMKPLRCQSLQSLVSCLLHTHTKTMF